MRVRVTLHAVRIHEGTQGAPISVWLNTRFVLQRARCHPDECLQNEPPRQKKSPRQLCGLLLSDQPTSLASRLRSTVDIPRSKHHLGYSGKRELLLHHLKTLVFLGYLKIGCDRVKVCLSVKCRSLGFKFAPL